MLMRRARLTVAISGYCPGRVYGVAGKREVHSVATVCQEQAWDWIRSTLVERAGLGPGGELTSIYRHRPALQPLWPEGL